MDVSSLVPAGLQAGQVDMCEVQAGYNKFSENLRKFTPQAIQCAIFCGGSRCKYENSKAWPPVHMAIQNIFSHWVTDDVLAMARPNTAQIIKKDIIAQFQGWSIKTIINLQTPGEHASCGGPLEDSGFTYDPNVFMKHGIYYYNFALKDYGDATMGKLLDMVKVVAFAVQEGRVAIHCHAGLGRTGVLIACYLIYGLRVRANDAIRFVRMKRPSAIQTRGQILCIQEFEHFVLPQMIVFPLNSTIGERKPCSLQSHLKKQRNVLHGYEQRTFKYIPKLCDCQEDNSPCEIEYKISSTAFTQKFISHVLDKLRDGKGNIRHSYSWAESLADSYDCSSKETKLSLRLMVNEELLILPDYSDSTKACASGSQASSRGTLDDIGRLSDVFCTSPDTPSCDSAFPVLDDNCVDDVLGDGIHGQDLVDNDCYKEIQSHMDLKAAAQSTAVETVNTEEIIRALVRDSALLSDRTKKCVQDYQVEILFSNQRRVSEIELPIDFQMDLNHRSTAWQRLKMETDLDILSGLLFEWLETLKYPLLDVDSLSYIVAWSSKPQRCLEKLPSCSRYLLEYLLRFISRLRPMTPESQSLITKRFMATLTQQSIWIKSAFYPSNRNFQKLRRGTAAKLNEFFVRLMNLIEEVNTQETEKPAWSSKWDLVPDELKETETINEECS
ncbi:PREDICTED: protein tyrosine phosphatase domain-containing protein 1-like [Eufriesea mexicana]|uniref:protein tyrosine phosphatase domain-containing protein 1-like n=1 Tax=Eufriesea mexicana TaxID=516756 RepID=UPI00083BF12D|nr:PREDICTED: protein tyrosine phosphatase domain-containing protein 1-like [Eufriesea mexicana]